MHKASTWHLLDKQFIISSEPVLSAVPFWPLPTPTPNPLTYPSWPSFKANELFQWFSTDFSPRFLCSSSASLIYFDYLFAESQTNATSRFSSILLFALFSGYFLRHPFCTGPSFKINVSLSYLRMMRGKSRKSENYGCGNSSNSRIYSGFIMPYYTRNLN